MMDRIRRLWLALWRGTGPSQAPAPQPAPAAAAPDGPTHTAITDSALMEARRRGRPMLTPLHFTAPAPPSRTFEPMQPAPGIVRSGSNLAMDEFNPGMSGLIGWAASSSWAHEGLAFFGYPYLAELQQRSEYSHANTIWAQHCVKKWIKITGDAARVEKIEEEFERLHVRDLVQDLVLHDFSMGRSHLFMDFDDYDDPAELNSKLVISPSKISPKRPLKRLKVIQPLWCYPGIYESTNPLAPDYYVPREWYVNGMIVDASRLLTVVGRPVPDLLKAAYAFGGLSLTQMMKPYVDNWLRARQSVSDLLHSFSVMVLKTDMAQRMAADISGADLFARVDLMTVTRDNRGTYVIDRETEEFANVSAQLAGLEGLSSQAFEQVASVANIPLSQFHGITPTGLNASSEGEFRVFYDKVLSYCNTHLAPHIRTLMDVVQLSLFGDIDSKIAFEFISLWETSDKERADIRKTDADTDAVLINAGAISPDESRARLNDEEGGPYHGRLDGDAPTIEMDDDDDIAAADHLEEGSSRATIAHNIEVERAAGDPQKQAIAIALSKARGE